MSERKYYKAINFDLDTHVLNDVHPSGYYQNAYYDLKRFFKKKGFDHRQGSGYVSKEKLTSTDIFELLDDLYHALPWISEAVKAFDVTNVGNQYDLAEDIRAFAAVDIDIKPE